MSILVTGGAGFIGSHFIELLLARTNFSIVGVDNFCDFYDSAEKRKNIAGFCDDPRVTFAEESYSDVARMRSLIDDHEVTHAVHLGAHAGVRRSVVDPVAYQENNVVGTAALLEAIKSARLERFLFASSSTVYGHGAETPFCEDSPLGTPASPYGVSKRAGELLCLNHLHLHGTPIVCLRLFSVYGPRLRPDLAMCIFADAMLSEERLPLFGDGSIERDFTHVSDVCAGLLSALTEDAAIGECINLGHNTPIAMQTVIAELGRSLGVEPSIEHLPEKPGDLPATSADLSKAKRILNYQPNVPFEHGVREFASWYRRHRASIAEQPGA